MSILKVIWLNVWFYTLLVLFSLVAVPALTLFVWVQVPFISRRHAMRLFRRAIRWYGFVVIYILPWPLVKVRYEDRAPRERAGPYIVVCNHRSSSDPFLMAVLPIGEGIQVVNTWTLRLPLWGLGARLAGYVSINDMAVGEFFHQAAALLRSGVSIVAFPEGTRSNGPVMGPFHGTLFRLALQEKVPIVPLCISGNERIPARRTMLLRPGRITLRRLPALTWADYKDLPPFQLKTRVHEIIRRELDVMEGRGVPPGCQG
jgi:1-acyl-sn-glycerol-3-phosphate acyltransferase